MPTEKLTEAQERVKLAAAVLLLQQGLVIMAAAETHDPDVDEAMEMWQKHVGELL